MPICFVGDNRHGDGWKVPGAAAPAGETEMEDRHGAVVAPCVTETGGRMEHAAPKCLRGISVALASSAGRLPSGTIYPCSRAFEAQELV